MENKVKNFLFSFILTAITGALCSYFTRWGIANWYGQLAQPLYAAPNIVFSIAWGIIYVLLIISFYRVLNTSSTLKPPAARMFYLQLILQILWCFLFFYQGMLLAGMIILLWLIYTVYRMIRLFLQIDYKAGAMNYFYILYLCYAAFLNFVFMWANGYVVTF